MKNNRLCAGLALSLCLIAVPMGSQAGSPGAASLCEAAKKGDIALVRQLLDTGVQVNAAKDAQGETPLHHAAFCGHDIVVRHLLVAGARTDVVTWAGATPLYVTAYAGHDAVVRRLLAAGANVNGADGVGEVPLLGAALRDHAAVIRLLLEAGADVDAANDGRGTALHGAVYGGYEATARLLLEFGAEVDAVDAHGCTALHRAATEGHEAIARLLLEFGAEADAVNVYGCTALHRAATEGHEATTRLLAVRGATPLARAACEKIISKEHYRQGIQTNLERLKPMTERASLERKQAIESTLDEVKMLPRDLQRLITSMSEHPDVRAWWRQADRLRAVSDMRLPIRALERVMMFDSPQDIGVFQGMLE